MKKLNLIDKKCEIMNTISYYFSNEMYLLHRTYHNNIPYEEELNLYNKMLRIEEFLHSLNIKSECIDSSNEQENSKII